MQIEDSDGEQEEDPTMERDVIANQLFDGDDVSMLAMKIQFVLTMCVIRLIQFVFFFFQNANLFNFCKSGKSSFLNFHFLHASKKQKLINK